MCTTLGDPAAFDFKSMTYRVHNYTETEMTTTLQLHYVGFGWLQGGN